MLGGVRCLCRSVVCDGQGFICFFSSRRRHTRYWCDWSSGVCSSDLPSLPKDVLGVRGPVARAFGDQLPRALAWGLGMGLMGGLLASLVGSFANQLGGDTILSKEFATIFPGYNFASAGGWLQLY